MSNALPEGFKVRTRKEWEELQSSEDSTQRGLVNIALRALGIAPAKYMQMPAADRIDYIVKRQAEAGHGGEPEAKAEKAPKPKAGEARPAAAAPAAAPAAEAKAAPAAAPAASVDLSGLKKQVADLQSQLVELAKVVIEQGRFLRETHYILRVQTLADAELAANLDDEGIRAEYAGKLLGAESGNG